MKTSVRSGQGVSAGHTYRAPECTRPTPASPHSPVSLHSPPGCVHPVLRADLGCSLRSHPLPPPLRHVSPPHSTRTPVRRSCHRWHPSWEDSRIRLPWDPSPSSGPVALTGSQPFRPPHETERGSRREVGPPRKRSPLPSCSPGRPLPAEPRGPALS